MQEENRIDLEPIDEVIEDPINRRRHPRSVFTFPVELKLFSQKADGMSFAGYLKDISLGGAGLLIEDPYGRFNMEEAKNFGVRLTLSIPREGKSHIFAVIQWIKKIEGTSRVSMGISFRNLEFNDSLVIEKLIGLKSKDHTMMWNLWEKYCQ